MNVLLALTSLLAIILSVTAEPPDCPDAATKEALLKYKVGKEITPLLKENTYVDIWRRKETTDIIDCSMTKFTVTDNVLFSNMHNVQKHGTPLFFNDKLTENKDQSSFNSYGEYKEAGKDTVIYDEYMHVFYADEFVWGYLSCDLNDHFLRMSVAARKDKLDDKEAAESLKNAEKIMNELKTFVPDEMTKFERKQCPEKV